ncbi:putative CCR4-NOT transcription complex subunit 8-like protein, partial [Naja naja]
MSWVFGKAFRFARSRSSTSQRRRRRGGEGLLLLLRGRKPSIPGSRSPRYFEILEHRFSIAIVYKSFKMPAALAENSQVICEVWANNLEEEMRKIREIVLSYSYIAM